MDEIRCDKCGRLVEHDKNVQYVVDPKCGPVKWLCERHMTFKLKEAKQTGNQTAVAPEGTS